MSEASIKFAFNPIRIDAAQVFDSKKQLKTK